MVFHFATLKMYQELKTKQNKTCCLTLGPRTCVFCQEKHCREDLPCASSLDFLVCWSRSEVVPHAYIIKNTG